MTYYMIKADLVYMAMFLRFIKKKGSRITHFARTLSILLHVSLV